MADNPRPLMSIDDLILSKALARFYELLAQPEVFKLPLSRGQINELSALGHFLETKLSEQVVTSTTRQDEEKPEHRSSAYLLSLAVNTALPN